MLGGTGLRYDFLALFHGVFNIGDAYLAVLRLPAAQIRMRSVMLRQLGLST
jgi:hypothetical protein